MRAIPPLFRAQARLIVGLMAALALAACSGGGGSGGSTPSEDETENPGGDMHDPEGSVDAPVTLTLGEAHSGSVDTGSSYYTVAAVAGTSYNVAISDLSADLDVYCYDDDGTFTFWVDRPFLGSTLSETCSVTPASGDALYIGVNGGFSATGGTFTLVAAAQPGNALVDPGSPANVGSVESPIPLIAGFQQEGQVGDGESYYAVTVEPGVEYTVSFSGHSDSPATLDVFDDAAFSDGLCSEAAADPAACEATPGSATLYVKATAGENPSFFSIMVLRSEGTAAAPLLRHAQKPGFGQVNGTDDASHYRFTVAAGGNFTYALTNTLLPVAVSVYDGASFAGDPCVIDIDSVSDLPGICALQDTSSTISVKVTRGTGLTGSSFEYIASPYVTEGTVDPPDLSLNVPFSGEVGGDDESHYTAIGLVDGESYAVTLYNMTNLATLVVYGDAFTTMVCPPAVLSGWSSPPGIVPETCTVKIEGSTTLSIGVNSEVGSRSRGTNAGAAYDLVVTQVDKPDLIVGITALDYNVSPPLVTISYTLTNQGTATIPAGTVLLLYGWENPGAAPAPGDTSGAPEVHALSVDLLPEGTATGSFTFDSENCDGTAYVLVDALDEVDELYEYDQNNVSAPFPWVCP